MIKTLQGDEIMTTVRKILETKENATNFSVEVSGTVLDAIKVMAEAHIGAVLVTDGGKIVGIFTERDYLIKGELEERTAKSTKIKDVMTPQMITVTKDTSVEQCMGLMDQYKIRHLPVVENDQLVGLVSIRDVMVAALQNKESEIRGLENYIMGSGFQS
jgi:signal-transduction protein with cAMP-binding, CBS, and nucleotidyltransferase domain